ncbi:MAG: metal-dependent hydrolase [Halobacteriales archaeon]|nr:metal-dependent hydrolase [Halobacteriales archaeon]
MLFPTHLVAGYVIGERWDWPLPWVLLGAAAPDLIDKPLAMAGLVELYQTIGHSLALFATIAALALLGGVWAALWVGWASHLLLDAVHMVVNGRPGDLLFLAWPVIEHTPAVNLPPVEFLFAYIGTPSFYLELVIWAVFGYVLLTANGAE